MKKWYAGMMIGLLAFSLIACGKKAETPGSANASESVSETTPAPVSDTASEPTADESDASGSDEDASAPDTDTASEPTASQQEGTPAKVLLEDFLAKADDGQYAKTGDMADALLKNSVIPFMGATMEVQPGYLTGFTEEIKGFSEGTMFGPSIGAIPFVGYIFKSDDPDALAAALREKADKRWNVCTEADEMICEVKGDTVFFVMAPAAFEEE